MPAEVFFDTSIVVYAVKGDDPRAATAEALLASGGIISVQVLNEFVAVASRKLRMEWKEIHEALAYIRELCGKKVVTTTLDIHKSALGISQRYGYHIYDSLMVAAAHEMGCVTLYSEDMQHGQKIGSLRIVNPFAKSLSH